MLQVTKSTTKKDKIKCIYCKKMIHKNYLTVSQLVSLLLRQKHKQVVTPKAICVDRLNGNFQLRNQIMVAFLILFMSKSYFVLAVWQNKHCIIKMQAAAHRNIAALECQDMQMIEDFASYLSNFSRNWQTVLKQFYHLF